MMKGVSAAVNERKVDGWNEANEENVTDSDRGTDGNYESGYECRKCG